MANPDLEPPGGVLGDDDGDYGDLAPEPSMMDADHPLLARAQAALHHSFHTGQGEQFHCIS